MSNRRRRCEPDLTYHTCSRCIDCDHMMKKDEMKDLMIKVMAMALEKYNFELLSYVIMENHFHFYIRTLPCSASISRIMQYIKSQFARRFNKISGRKGPFWNERFSDTIIEETHDPDLMFNYINCYIHLNPVRAGCVDNSQEYKYSSIKFYLEEEYIPPLRLTFHKAFLELGNDFMERSKKFLEFEEMFLKRVFPAEIFG